MSTTSIQEVLSSKILSGDKTRATEAYLRDLWIVHDKAIKDAIAKGDIETVYIAKLYRERAQESLSNSFHTTIGTA